MRPLPHHEASANEILEVFYVAGYQFHQGAELRMELVLEHADPLVLVREPENPHDPKAIAIYTEGWIKLGYVPRAVNDYFATLLDAGITLETYVYNVWPMEEPWRREVVVRV